MTAFFGAIFNSSHELAKKDLFEESKNLLVKNVKNNIFSVNSQKCFLHLSGDSQFNPLEFPERFCTHSPIISGSIFRRDTMEPPPYIHHELHKASMDNKLASVLIEKYWGEYLIFNFRKDDDTVDIYRDPSGMAHIYYSINEQGLFFSSDVYLLLEIFGQNKSNYNWDWEYIASYLSLGILNTPKTAFKGIHELLPGTFLRYIKGNLSIKCFWEPVSYIKPISYNPLDLSIAQLLQKVCVALTKNLPDVFLELSGGLDSSALFLTLNSVLKENQKFTQVNYYHPQVGGSNELSHIKNLLKKYTSNLMIQKFEYLFKPCCTKMWSKPHPGIMRTTSKINLRESVGIETFTLINGDGGDQLFLSHISQKVVSDYIIDKGLRGSYSFLKNICLANQDLLMKYLSSTLKDIYKYYTHSYELAHTPYPPQLLSLTPELKALIETSIFKPPFWDKLIVQKIPPAKLNQILVLYHSSAFSNSTYTGIKQMSPYLSQPMIEHCLAIPCHTSFNKGTSRWHFKKEIAQLYNNNEIWNTFKGDSTGVRNLSIKNGINDVKSILLDGQLVKEGLFDKDRLENYINLVASGQCNHLWFIYHLLSLELWIAGFD